MLLFSILLSLPQVKICSWRKFQTLSPSLLCSTCESPNMWLLNFFMGLIIFQCLPNKTSIIILHKSKTFRWILFIYWSSATFNSLAPFPAFCPVHLFHLLISPCPFKLVFLSYCSFCCQPFVDLLLYFFWGFCVWTLALLSKLTFFVFIKKTTDCLFVYCSALHVKIFKCVSKQCCSWTSGHIPFLLS